MYPNKTLSNFDLLEMTQHIPNFRGIFMRDDLPKKPWLNESGILNLDESKGPGTHWTCWYKKGDLKIYFDSYGLITPVELQKYLKEKNIKKPSIMRNTDEIQPRGSKICGFLCVEVLTKLNDEKTFFNIISELNKRYGKHIW